MKKTILKAFFKSITEICFVVTFWDGETIVYGSGNPLLKIVFNREIPINFRLNDPVLSFGEAYADGIIDIEGDLEGVISFIQQKKGHPEKTRYLNKMLFPPSVNQVSTDLFRKKQKQDIKRHYDLGNDFFSLWLDETMSYSCAYFKNLDDTLTKAQLNKIDLILKKLHLKSGERLLDIGCGWGSLIIRAARQYNVKAMGITISDEQYRNVKQQINELDLDDMLEVRLLHYMDLPGDQPLFDKIVSVGMFEHVGRENLGKYMEKVNSLLVPGGLSLLHTITGTGEASVNSWIDKYIFPGGYIPSLRETIWLLPQYDFHLIHVESLKMHYAMTLDKWYENFIKHVDEIRLKFGDRFIRMWSLYFRGCAASFRASGLNVHQILVSKGINNNLPLTLENIYCGN